MNEFLIKLRALFTGTGFSDAEAGLKRVKAAADEAAKATTKATTAPNASPAQPGKMFSPQESKDLARSIMAEATQKAEAAEKALRRVEDQANQTKQALQGGGTSGGTGGGIMGWIGRAGAALAIGVGLGKAASSQIDKITESIQRSSEASKEFAKAQRDLANASSFDAIIQGLQLSNDVIKEARKNLQAMRKDWGAWSADLVMGAFGSRPSQAMEDQIRGMEVTQFSAGLKAAKRNLNLQRALAEVADDPAAQDRLRRQDSRRLATYNLEEQIKNAPAWSATAQREGAQQLQALLASFAAEDQALNKINALKQSALALELEIKQAKQAGNQVEVERLQWIRTYNAELEKAKAANAPDPYGYARDSANASMPDKAQEWMDFDVAMNKARQEGLARQYAEEDAAREKALAAEKAAAKEAADAKIEEAERASRQQDMELEGRLGASRPGREQRDLERLRDYKTALSQLTEGLTPGTAAWSAAAAKAGEIADNLARAKSNQDKLNASASAESPDSTRGGAGRIAAERARAEERAQRYESFGAYGTAERTRKAAEARAESEAAKELDKMGQRSAAAEAEKDTRSDWKKLQDSKLSQKPDERSEWEKLQDSKLSDKAKKQSEAEQGKPAPDPATAAADKAVENVATAQLDASASALSEAASALSAAAAALQDVGRYAD